MELSSNDPEDRVVRQVLNLLTWPDALANLKGLEYIFKLAAVGKDVSLYLAASAWRTFVTRKRLSVELLAAGGTAMIYRTLLMASIDRNEWGYYAGICVQDVLTTSNTLIKCLALRFLAQCPKDQLSALFFPHVQAGVQSMRKGGEANFSKELSNIVLAGPISLKRTYIVHACEILHKCEFCYATDVYIQKWIASFWGWVVNIVLSGNSTLLFLAGLSAVKMAFRNFLENDNEERDSRAAIHLIIKYLLTDVKTTQLMCMIKLLSDVDKCSAMDSLSYVLSVLYSYSDVIGEDKKLKPLKSSLVHFPTLPRPSEKSEATRSKYYLSQAELSQCSDTSYHTLKTNIAVHVLPLLSLSPMVTYSAGEFFLRLQLSPCYIPHQWILQVASSLFDHLKSPSLTASPHAVLMVIDLLLHSLSHIRGTPSESYFLVVLPLLISKIELLKPSKQITRLTHVCELILQHALASDYASVLDRFFQLSGFPTSATEAKCFVDGRPKPFIVNFLYSIFHSLSRIHYSCVYLVAELNWFRLACYLIDRTSFCLAWKETRSSFPFETYLQICSFVLNACQNPDKYITENYTDVNPDIYRESTRRLRSLSTGVLLKFVKVVDLIALSNICARVLHLITSNLSPEDFTQDVVLSILNTLGKNYLDGFKLDAAQGFLSHNQFGDIATVQITHPGNLQTKVSQLKSEESASQAQGKQTTAHLETNLIVNCFKAMNGKVRAKVLLDYVEIVAEKFAEKHEVKQIKDPLQNPAANRLTMSTSSVEQMPASSASTKLAKKMHAHGQWESKHVPVYSNREQVEWDVLIAGAESWNDFRTVTASTQGASSRAGPLHNDSNVSGGQFDLAQHMQSTSQACNPQNYLRTTRSLPTTRLGSNGVLLPWRREPNDLRQSMMGDMESNVRTRNLMGASEPFALECSSRFDVPTRTVSLSLRLRNVSGLDLKHVFIRPTLYGQLVPVASLAFLTEYIFHIAAEEFVTIHREFTVMEFDNCSVVVNVSIGSDQVQRNLNDIVKEKKVVEVAPTAGKDFVANTSASNTSTLALNRDQATHATLSTTVASSTSSGASAHNIISAKEKEGADSKSKGEKEATTPSKLFPSSAATSTSGSAMSNAPIRRGDGASQGKVSLKSGSAQGPMHYQPGAGSALSAEEMAELRVDDFESGGSFQSAPIAFSMRQFITPIVLLPATFAKLLVDLPYSLSYRVDLSHVSLEALGLQLGALSQYYCTVLRMQHLHHFQLGLCGKSLWGSLQCLSMLAHEFDNRIHITMHVYSQSMEFLSVIKRNCFKFTSDLLGLSEIESAPGQNACSILISNETTTGFATSEERTASNTARGSRYTTLEEIESTPTAPPSDQQLLQNWLAMKQHSLHLFRK